MARYRAVLLDVDGTLVDSNDLHAQAWEEVLGHHGIEVPFERVRSLIGMGSDKIGPELTGLPKDSPALEALSRARAELFRRKYLARVRPLPGARALVERLQQDGLRVVVASSAGREELQGLLERGAIADLLRQATSSDDAERSKPDPDIVVSALAKAEVAPDEAIMIGDTPYDVAAAQRAKVAIIGLRSGGWDAASLRGAVVVYRDPADLLAHYPAPFTRVSTQAAPPSQPAQR